MHPGSCFQRKKERKERKEGEKGRKVKDFFAPGVVPATFGDEIQERCNASIGINGVSDGTWRR